MSNLVIFFCSTLCRKPLIRIRGWHAARNALFWGPKKVSSAKWAEDPAVDSRVWRLCLNGNHITQLLGIHCPNIWRWCWKSPTIGTSIPHQSQALGRIWLRKWLCGKSNIQLHLRQTRRWKARSRMWMIFGQGMGQVVDLRRKNARWGFP